MKHIYITIYKYIYKVTPNICEACEEKNVGTPSVAAFAAQIMDDVSSRVRFGNSNQKLKDLLRRLTDNWDVEWRYNKGVSR